MKNEETKKQNNEYVFFFEQQNLFGTNALSQDETGRHKNRNTTLLIKEEKSAPYSEWNHTKGTSQTPTKTQKLAEQPL